MIGNMSLESLNFVAISFHLFLRIDYFFVVHYRVMMHAGSLENTKDEKELYVARERGT